jgi:uncharacterized membrane protein YfcA
MTKHVIALLIIIVATAIVAWNLPYDVDPTEVFMGGFVVFVIYLASVFFLKTRRDARR